MATVPHLKIVAGKNTAAPATLGGSNTFTFEPGKNQILVVRNDTGSGVACVIDGAGGSTVAVPGVPGGVDVSGGYSLGTIADGAEVVVPLDSISAYLQGVISITGSGLTAYIIN